MELEGMVGELISLIEDSSNPDIPQADSLEAYRRACSLPHRWHSSLFVLQNPSRFPPRIVDHIAFFLGRLPPARGGFSVDPGQIGELIQPTYDALLSLLQSGDSRSLSRAKAIRHFFVAISLHMPDPAPLEALGATSLAFMTFGRPILGLQLAKIAFTVAVRRSDFADRRSTFLEALQQVFRGLLTQETIFDAPTLPVARMVIGLWRRALSWTYESLYTDEFTFPLIRFILEAIPQMDQPAESDALLNLIYCTSRFVQVFVSEVDCRRQPDRTDAEVRLGIFEEFFPATLPLIMDALLALPVIAPDRWHSMGAFLLLTLAQTFDVNQTTADLFDRAFQVAILYGQVTPEELEKDFDENPSSFYGMAYYTENECSVEHPGTSPWRSFRPFAVFPRRSSAFFPGSHIPRS
jgi:hypothetical protein